MRLLLSGWCGLALAVFGSQPAHAAKPKPLPVPKDPLALATPTWTAGPAARGRVASQPGKGLRLGAVAKQQLGGGDVVAVISNKADAGGLQRAERAGIATNCLPHTDFMTK